MNGPSDFYLELALWAVANFVEDCNELERKKRMNEVKEFCKKTGFSEEQYWNDHANSKPYEEFLLLSTNIYFEDEADNIEINKTGTNENPLSINFFDLNFPFAFAPNRLKFIPWYNEQLPTTIYSYEDDYILIVKKQ